MEKNTASGALLVRTKAPSHEQDGFAEVTIGDDSLLNFSTAFNLSLIDGKLASRTTLFSSNRDGFVKAVNTQEPNLMSVIVLEFGNSSSTRQVTT